MGRVIAKISLRYAGLTALVLSMIWLSHNMRQEALAQATTSEILAAELSRTVQTQARKALERHLKPEEFQVFAKVTPAAAQAQPVPYMPETLAPVPGSDASPELMAPYIQRIELEVLIADRFDAAAKAKIQTILQKSLALNDARGDTVKFSSLGLTPEREDSETTRELARTEAEARTARTERDQLAREREDAKRESEGMKRDLAAAKLELERITRERLVTEPKQPGAEPKTPDSVTRPADVPVERSFWQENLAVFIGAALAFLAILSASFVVRAAARTLGDAVQSIGSGLPVMADKLSESLAQKPALLPPPDYGRQNSLTLSKPSNTTAAGPSLPIEAVAKRVIELHEELVIAVDDDNEALVIAYITQILEERDLVERAVATMELLGKERANRLYHRMALNHQQLILTFLKSGQYSRPKGEVVIEAGEALKTKLFGAGFASRAQLAPQVVEKLLALGIDEQVAMARGLDGEVLARLFLYFDPPRLAGILSRLREKDPKRFEKAALTIVKMPEVETATNLDSELLTVVEAQLVKASGDIQAPYLQIYRSLVEMADDDVAESLAESFAAAHPRIERYIRETVVTFGTFFKLHGDIQEEILGSMNNRDIASVIVMLKPDLQASILNQIEARRQELINEESERLTARGQRQVVLAHRAAKRQIVERIIQIKGQGPLSELLAPQTEGLPSAAGSQAGFKAA